MPVEGDVLFKTREEILAELQEGMLALIPDIYLGDDGNLNLFFQVLAGVMESVFLANQIISEDMFVRTANESALEAWGIQYGIPRKQGTPSTGELLFTTDGGVAIPVGTQVAYDAETGEDALYFTTTEGGVSPDPGIPSAPTPTDGGAGGVPEGTYEYAVTFYTDEGETEIGEVSEPIVMPAGGKMVTLLDLAVGGPGTVGRKVYRSQDGGEFGLVATVTNNSQDFYSDSAPTATQAPPEASTAERIRLTAESEDNGEIYNLLPNTITELTDVPDGVTGVVNQTAFVGGTEREAEEDFRERLLSALKSSGTGSEADIKNWAEEVEGVESATVFPNTPLNGHVTVRVSGPDGSVPTQGVLDAVESAIEARDVANVTVHVDVFTAVPTDVTVDVVVDEGYTVGDVTAAVQAATADYINSLEIGETYYTAGNIAAVFGLPGIIDVTISIPAGNQTTGVTQKRTPGTISVV